MVADSIPTTVAGREKGRIYQIREVQRAVGTRPLPQPTRDLATLSADLDFHGFCFVADVVSAETRARLRQRFDEQHAAEARAGASFSVGINDRRVWNLLNKGSIFREVLSDPITEALMTHALGEQVLLSGYGGFCTQPRSLAQALHNDQAGYGFFLPLAVGVNTALMVDDFDEFNGATRVIPGSHLWTPDEIEAVFEMGPQSGTDGRTNPPGTIAAAAPAGTRLVYDTRLMHGTGVNQTQDRLRLGLFALFQRPWLRTLENPFLSIDEDVFEALPEKIKRWLGYEPHFLFGGFQAPGISPPMEHVRPERRIGELH